ncbi:dinitrogenase iron-molybdenum cofactor [Ruminiclostridium hungatei]|uniref:Dinitrogenase iron-molybdenum cofactor n=1 Tax=Ruminiclostridium hungatei TaxID=48256 RepID=A0A1V4SHU8_RUMHU|nr:NifB/NifX family molybdenum-iron cluster-binding protein [Ruminiclostridium hungatei]OPX43076.1 dinitrogenase iron-molybdenum cofactor [Ruminiclostridium hungatei]
MAYKIAIASSDEIHIDETFGAAKLFHIFEINDGKYEKVEERFANENNQESQCGVSGGCSREGCHSAVSSGCNGNEGNSKKVQLIADCRCVICKKIGFQIQKQLERKAITVFDVSCTVNQALEKILFYYGKIDKCQSLRGAGSKKTVTDAEPV